MGAQDSVVDRKAYPMDIERCLEAAVIWFRERPQAPTHNEAEWELWEAASNIMSDTYDDDEGE